MTTQTLIPELAESMERPFSYERDGIGFITGGRPSYRVDPKITEPKRFFLPKRGSKVPTRVTLDSGVRFFN